MRSENDPTAISPYSLAQMDNFYQAFATGSIKPTSVMNYLQHLFIAERCEPGNWVLDVCCGRGLQVPLLKQVVPALGGYVGIDISQEHLQEAGGFIRYGDGRLPPFPCELIHGDVTSELVRLNRLFDIVIYTSALEHMEKDAGIASLQQIFCVLHPQGTFYLSTPQTPGSAPKKLQHRVHIYEWEREELEAELTRIGFIVTACYGLLSPENVLVAAALHDRFGPGAVSWFEELQHIIPMPFLGPVCAAALPEIATELFYVCRRCAH